MYPTCMSNKMIVTMAPDIYPFMLLVLLIFGTRIFGMDSNAIVTVIPETPVSDLGEGPFWDPANKHLYYVDAFVGDVHRYDSVDKNDSKLNLGDLVTIIIPVANKSDTFLVSLRSKVLLLNWKEANKGQSKILAEVAPELDGRERFNDGKIDAAGRLWIGTVLHGSDGSITKHGGALYRLDRNQNGSYNFSKMCSNITLSNGMAWNRNNTIMYFNDSEERIIRVFDFDLKTGTISNEKIFMDLSKYPTFSTDEYPDGMTMDSEDYLWIALYNGGRIVRINPNTKQVVQSISIPAAKRTTSLTFGGPNLDQIFVTTGKGEHPDSGRIHKITGLSGITGIPMFYFKIIDEKTEVIDS